MGKLRQYNNEIIIGHNVGPSDMNSTLYAIKVSAPVLYMITSMKWSVIKCKYFLKLNRLLKVVPIFTCLLFAFRFIQPV